MNHPSSFAIKWHGRITSEDCSGTHEEGLDNPPERLEQEATYLQSTRPQTQHHHHGVLVGATPAPWPVIQGSLQLEPVYNQLCGGPCDCITPIVTSISIWKWPVTRLRSTITTWPILWDSRKEIKSHFSGPEESHLSYSHPGKAHTRWSPGQMTWLKGSSNTLKQIQWWYTWTDWHNTYRLHRKSSLKEGALQQKLTTAAQSAAGLLQ